MFPLNTLQLHHIFNKLDKNGDGLVTIDELMWLVERIGVRTNRDELELLLGKRALDPFDFVFFYETLNNMFGQEKHDVDKKDEILERDLREAFRVFDLNGDGFISCEELQIALSRLGLWDEGCGQDCQMMIGVYDSNSDGLLDFDEFKDMMMFA
ncbi:probable calcium-binding protein cml44 [Phtheirospermum japonicum]|uniref:Probable calcium-binding protein cml44 n=1 Tax=Phtheirospermum japonicum TaxID=374723 RepID=A0A830D5I1_9LAMI|nr:probable calcium-binding protein cml44 [Phtheirospermum japonicum]